MRLLICETTREERQIIVEEFLGSIPQTNYLLQYASIALQAKTAVPSPPALSIFSVNSPPAAYI